MTAAPDEDKRAHVREWWGKKPGPQIAADLGISRQAVSQIGHRMGLPKLTNQHSTSRPWEGECTDCGAVVRRKPGGLAPPRLCKRCRAKPTVGAKAYHARRVLKLPWPEIADAIGYRQDRVDRGMNLYKLARNHALKGGLLWPLPAGKGRGA